MYTLLLGGIPTPLKNMTSSVGMMKFPIYGKMKNVPNHQPENLHLLIRNLPKKTIDSPRFVDLPLGK